MDESGDVFVADYGNNAVKEVVAVNGVATPVTTPTATAVTDSTLGAKP